MIFLKPTLYGMPFIWILISFLQEMSGLPVNGTNASLESIIKNVFINKFLTLRTICTKEAMIVVATMAEPFEGAIYAQNYPLECRSFGFGAKEVKLYLKAATCGIKVLEKENGTVEYQSNIYVQYDRLVQRSVDEEIQVKCTPLDFPLPIKDNDTKMEYPDLSGFSRSLGDRFSPEIATSHQEKWKLENEEMTDENLSTLLLRYNKEKDSSNKIPLNCWLEILKGSDVHGKPAYDHFQVGENITLLIKVQRIPHLVPKVVNCTGHDGTDENQQPLLDSNGCTIDESIMPQLTEIEDQETRMHMMYATFPAFKFPERNNLHVTCSVLLCRHRCPHRSCDKGEMINEKPSHLRETRDPGRTLGEEMMDVAVSGLDPRGSSSVLEVLEVFNSVEIQAPGIETETFQVEFNDLGEEIQPFENPKVICTNSHILVLAFGLLLGIFIISTVFSLVVFFWSRLQRRKTRKFQNFVFSPYRAFESCS